MKKKWENPSLKIILCHPEKIQGNIFTMSEEELYMQLELCGYPFNGNTSAVQLPPSKSSFS